MLTTRFDAQTMAEFAVAAEVLGFRSINALVHQLVYQKINEAKRQTEAEEFAVLVESKKVETAARSQKKLKERLEILGEILPKGEKKITILPMLELEKPKIKKAA